MSQHGDPGQGASPLGAAQQWNRVSAGRRLRLNKWCCRGQQRRVHGANPPPGETEARLAVAPACGDWLRGDRPCGPAALARQPRPARAGPGTARTRRLRCSRRADWRGRPGHGPPARLAPPSGPWSPPLSPASQPQRQTPSLPPTAAHLFGRRRRRCRYSRRTISRDFAPLRASPPSPRRARTPACSKLGALPKSRPFASGLGLAGLATPRPGLCIRSAHLRSVKVKG